MSNQSQRMHRRLDAGENIKLRIALTDQVLGLLENGEITPVAAGLRLERQGIQPPFTVRKMIESELRNSEPEDTGIEVQDTPEAEEFEQAAMAYYAKLKSDSKAGHEERMARIEAGIKTP